MFCSACGSSRPTSAQYCPSCGTTFAAAGTVPAALPQDATASPSTDDKRSTLARVAWGIAIIGPFFMPFLALISLALGIVLVVDDQKSEGIGVIVVSILWGSFCLVVGMMLLGLN